MLHYAIRYFSQVDGAFAHALPYLFVSPDKARSFIESVNNLSVRYNSMIYNVAISEVNPGIIWNDMDDGIRCLLHPFNFAGDFLPLPAPLEEHAVPSQRLASYAGKLAKLLDIFDGNTGLFLRGEQYQEATSAMGLPEVLEMFAQDKPIVWRYTNVIAHAHTLPNNPLRFYRLNFELEWDGGEKWAIAIPAVGPYFEYAIRFAEISQDLAFEIYNIINQKFSLYRLPTTGDNSYIFKIQNGEGNRGTLTLKTYTSHEL